MSDTDTGASLDFMFGLSAKIGDLTDEVKKANLEARRRERENTPVAVKRAGGAMVPAAGSVPTAFGLGGPSNGFFWELRTIAVGGLTTGTTAAGTYEVYVTSQTSQAIQANRTLTDLVDTGTSMPLPGGYSSGQIIVQFGEELRVVIVGGTAGQAYAGVAYWRQYRTMAYGTEAQA